MMKMKYLQMVLGALIGMFAVVHPAPAQTWTQTSAPTENWQSVACSTDGTKLAAVAANAPIYTSSDSGVTWTESNTPSNNWICVASSANGTKLVAVVNGGLIYTSSDAGVTWAATGAPSAAWSCVASSSDGNKLVAGGDAGLYTSTNSGATWNLSEGVGGYALSWVSVASSADGTKLIAGEYLYDVYGSWPVQYVGYYGAMYLSTDSGATWNKPAFSLNHFSIWTSLASSSDGTHLVAAAYGVPLYTSTDSGATWTVSSAPAANWQWVASSASGIEIVAGGEGPAPIYVSPDWGAGWFPTTSPSTNWSSIACSASATKLVAAEYGGGIYTAVLPTCPLGLNMLGDAEMTTPQYATFVDPGAVAFDCNGSVHVTTSNSVNVVGGGVDM